MSDPVDITPVANDREDKEQIDATPAAPERMEKEQAEVPISSFVMEQPKTV